MAAHETRYARSGDVNIAYQVVGDGPLDLVYVPGWVSNIELMWEYPRSAHFLRRLTAFSRLVLFDKRGTGLSDRVPNDRLPTLEQRMDDVRAVLDAVGSERAALLGHSEGGNMCVLFAATEPDRVLATVLFTDIVGSTERAAALGDRAWRELLEAHHAAVRRELERYGGRELDTAGDGFFAAFDGPARAVRCALAVRDAVRALGLEVRAGVHTGECERLEGSLGGIAVHIGARVSARAGPGEVVVSSTVKDLTAGSGLELADLGEQELKGVPGSWRLFQVLD